MESHKLVVKLFADGAAGLSPDAVVPVFHALDPRPVARRPPADRRRRLRPRPRRPRHGARRPRGQHPPRPRRRPARPALRPQAARRRRRRRSATASPPSFRAALQAAAEAGAETRARRHPLPHRRDRLPHQRPAARPERRGDVRGGQAPTCRRSLAELYRRATSRSSTATTPQRLFEVRIKSTAQRVGHATFWPAWSRGGCDSACSMSRRASSGNSERQRRLLPARRHLPPRPQEDADRPSPRRAARRTRRTRLRETPGTRVLQRLRLRVGLEPLLADQRLHARDRRVVVADVAEDLRGLVGVKPRRAVRHWR